MIEFYITTATSIKKKQLEYKKGVKNLKYIFLLPAHFTTFQHWTAQGQNRIV